MTPNRPEKIESPQTKKIVHQTEPKVTEPKVTEPKVYYDSGYPMRSGRNPVCCRMNRNYFPFYENDFY
jgi:hypothetical protein